MTDKGKIKINTQSELALLINGTKIHELQSQILLDAIKSYLQYCNTSVFAWFFTDPESANNLQKELSLNCRAPIELIQEHLKTHPETGDFSFSFHLLKIVLKNKQLFSINTSISDVDEQSSRAKLQKHVSALNINGLEYVLSIARLYEAYKLPEAKKLYERAALLGSYDAQKKLLVDANKLFTQSKQWQSLGDKYYQEKAYTKAKVCYEQALVLDVNCNHSLYRLGLLHEYGWGVERNRVKAQMFYELGAQAGNKCCDDRLFLLFVTKNRANEWLALGDNYFFGVKGKAKDHGHAKWCYERVLENNPKHAEAIEKLKILSEFRLVTDVIKAPDYYEKAILGSNVYLQCLILEKVISSTELRRMKFSNERSWLHLLADLPSSSLLVAQVQNTVRKIIHTDNNALYARDKQGKTPFFKLAVNDFYNMVRILRPFEFIGASKKEAEISEFLMGIKANPKAEQHLLLVAGPPGLGKTEITRAVVKKQGFNIIEYAPGHKAEKYRGQRAGRIKEVFNNALEMNGPTCIFIDEIDVVVPDTEHADVSARCEEDITPFQIGLDNIKGRQIVLIGTTNYLERIKPAIKSRAGTAVIFDLPERANRQLIIQDLLRFAILEPTSAIIQKLTDATSGWSPRELKSYLDRVKNQQKPANAPLSDTLFETCFDSVRKELERPKKGHARMIAPRLTAMGATSRAMPLSDDLVEGINHICSFIVNSDVLIKINPGYKAHTLLFGPPGGGKTEFARMIVEKTNCPCFIVDPKNSLTELADVFLRAKSAEKAIIFIDEMDRFASSPDAAGLIQTEMDGFDKPKHPLVIIAATNHLEEIPSPILSRFGKKIEVLLPMEKQRAQFFKSIFTDMQQRMPAVFDESLEAEIKNGCLRLGRATGGFSIRDMYSVINQITPILFERVNSPQQVNKESLLMSLSRVIFKVKSFIAMENNSSLAANAARFFAHRPPHEVASVSEHTSSFKKGQ